MRQHRQGPVVAAVYVAAMFMAILDTTIVNVALPTVGRQLHVRPDAVGMVSIAYLVSLAVLIPASGWLGDRLGGRTALLGAIGLFTLASALCGLATSLPELIAFRILQGAGGAIMTPVGLSMLFRIYPPAERVRISSVIALFTTLAPALGPILGGVLTSEVSWRLVFFVNLPVGLVALAVGAVWLDAHRPLTPGRLDLAGLLLSGLGLGAAMYGVSEGPVRGWTDPVVLVAVALGVAMLIAMVRVELIVRAPLLDLRLLGNRLFRGSTCLYAGGSVAYLGGLYLAALFFQDALGLSAIQAGFTAFPSALGSMAGAQLVTHHLYARWGLRRLTATGLLVVTAALLAMTLVGAQTSLWLIRMAMLGLGFGIGLVFIPAQAASMTTISRAQTGHASAIFNAGKQLGGAVGVALLTTILAAAPAAHGSASPGLAAFHGAFAAAAVVSALTLVAVATLRDGAAATGAEPTPTRVPAANRALSPPEGEAAR